MSLESVKVMSVDQLRRVAPSVFASRADAAVSDAYSFIPTINVVESLIGEGWLVVSASEQNVRLDSRESFAKHTVRFTREEYVTGSNAQVRPFVGQVRPEVVLVNSHDRSSSLSLLAALFRLACLNGLMVTDATLGEFRGRHMGLSIHEVLHAAMQIMNGVPAILDNVKSLQAYRMSPEERQVLAAAAHALRWEDPTTAPIEASRLLQARRYGDDQTDLWTTYNVIQENLIKGGQRDPRRRTESGRRRGSVRAVVSIDEDISINRNLWTLAEMIRDGSLMG